MNVRWLTLLLASLVINGYAYANSVKLVNPAKWLMPFMAVWSSFTAALMYSFLRSNKRMRCSAVASNVAIRNVQYAIRKLINTKHLQRSVAKFFIASWILAGVPAYAVEILIPGHIWEYTFSDPTGNATWNTTVGGEWTTSPAPFGNVTSGDFAYNAYWPADGSDGDDLWVRTSINLNQCNLSNLTWNLGVDNGFKLYVNGTLVANNNAEGYTSRWEYSGNFSGMPVHTGANVIAVALEDHGGLTAFDMQINAAACPTYTVTPSANPAAGGTITPSGAQVVTQDATKAFTVAATSGYAKSNIVSGTCPQGTWSAGSTGSSNVWTTGAITSNCTVQFNFTAAITVPTAITNAATNVTATSATLNGSVSSNGATATASFDFGTTTSYGASASATPAQIYSNSAVAVTANQTDLSCGTNYHYRTKAVNSTGTGLGVDQDFNTLACIDQVISSLTFDPPSLNVGGTTTVSATGGNSGNPVSFSIDNSSNGICTLNDNIVTAVAAGNCTVVANQAGNADYNPAAPVLGSILATVKDNQTIGLITFNPTSLTVDGTVTVSATATSGLPVSFSSITPDICRVNGNTITGIIGDRLCTIAADQDGNANYNPAEQVTRDIKTYRVNQSIGPITFNPSTVVVGGTTTVKATATSGLPVSFSSSTSGICKVTGNIVTGVAVGTCTIAANQVGNAKYNPAPQVKKNVVIPKPVHGVCGSANGTTVPTAPSTNLCSAGTPSVVTGGGTWNWRCNGVNGGTSASCSANIMRYTVTPQAGNGGSVSPSAPQTVNYGATKSFAVTPSTNYVRNSVVSGTCPQGSWSGNVWTTGAVTANCGVIFSFMVGSPDFVVTATTLTPTAPIANSIFTAVVMVKNQGTAAGDGKFLDVWSNQTVAQTCGAVGNKRLAVGTLTTGASKILTFTNLPAGTAGVKTLQAFVDSGCGILESNEINNQLTKSYTVQ